MSNAIHAAIATLSATSKSGGSDVDPIAQLFCCAEETSFDFAALLAQSSQSFAPPETVLPGEKNQEGSTEVPGPDDTALLLTVTDAGVPLMAVPAGARLSTDTIDDTPRGGQSGSTAPTEKAQALVFLASLHAQRGLSSEDSGGKSAVPSDFTVAATTPLALAQTASVIDKADPIPSPLPGTTTPPGTLITDSPSPPDSTVVAEALPGLAKAAGVSSKIAVLATAASESGGQAAALPPHSGPPSDAAVAAVAPVALAKIAGVTGKAEPLTTATSEPITQPGAVHLPSLPSAAPPPVAPSPPSTAAIPLTPPVPIHEPSWSGDMGQKIVWMVKHDIQSAQLSVSPAHLGTIDITLNVGSDGATAIFQSANAEVRDLLEAALPRLRDVMSQAGIQLSDARVGPQNQGQPDPRQRGNERHHAAERGSNAILLSESAVNQPIQSTGRLSSGLVDLFA